jgi:hypothetical protein
MLVADATGEWTQAVRRANELAALGHTVTVYLPPGKTLNISRLLLETLFAVQQGGEIPRCDVLIALDPLARGLANANQHRACVTIADADRLSLILGMGRGLESLLRIWVEENAVALQPDQAA